MNRETVDFNNMEPVEDLDTYELIVLDIKKLSANDYQNLRTMLMAHLNKDEYDELFR